MDVMIPLTEVVCHRTFAQCEERIFFNAKVDFYDSLQRAWLMAFSLNSPLIEFPCLVSYHLSELIVIELDLGAKFEYDEDSLN